MLNLLASAASASQRARDGQLRVLFYGRPDTLDPTLEIAQAMSQRTEFHLLIEAAPAGWSPILSPRIEGAGIVDCAEQLREVVPGLGRYIERTASCHFVAYRNRRRIHPATLPVTAEMLRFVRRLSPDVLHFDTAFLRTALLLPLVPRIQVLTVHDPSPHSGERRWQTDVARRLLFRRVERFVVHSAAMREVLCERYGLSHERVDVVHLGPFDVFRLWQACASPRDERLVLFLGRLSPYKGLEVLARAAPLVADSVPGVRFVVAGPSAFGYRPPPSATLPNGGAFEVSVGRVANTDVARLVASASVVVCPYVDATQSGVVLTAYAFRTPVVVTSVGGLPEYVDDGHSGLIVPAGDATSLAGAIVRIVTEPDLGPRLQAGIEVLARGRLSWRHAADALLDTYARAM